MIALSWFSLLALLIITARVGGLWISIPLFLLGLLISHFKNKGLYIFAFLLPLVNAVPFFLNSGFPFNYFAPSLFLVAGLYLGNTGFKAKGYIPQSYSLYLTLLWLSAIFLLLRWSNITLSRLAFLKDTPVTPGGPRVSFGIFFPVITLALYSAGLFAYYLTKNVDRRKFFQFMSAGTAFAMAIGFLQWAGYRILISPGLWDKGIRFNATFSDPNAAGAFAGILFGLILLNYSKWKDLLFLLPPLIIVLLSSSKSGIILVGLSLVIVFFSRRITGNTRIALILGFILLVIPFIPHLKARFYRNYIALIKWKKLDVALTGRISLTSKAITGIKEYPVSGIGPGNFTFYTSYKFKKHGWIDIVPSVYLSSMVETGLIGGFFFILFLISFAAGRASPERSVLYILLFIFIFNNGLWNPEVMVIFWILLSGIPPRKIKIPLKISVSSLLIYLIALVLSFNSLHPAKWCVNDGTYYDYGFHQLEDNFKWTRRAAGIYGIFKNSKVRFETGFPFDKTKYSKQIVDVYWNGKKIKRLILNRFKARESLKISGEGFLEFRIKPWFIPAKLKLSKDPRELGIKIAGIW